MGDCKNVNAIEASDGTLFKDRQKAAEYQAELDFEEWYEDNYPLGNFAGSRVEVTDMTKWLKANSNKIMQLIGTH